MKSSLFYHYKLSKLYSVSKISSVLHKITVDILKKLLNEWSIDQIAKQMSYMQGLVIWLSTQLRFETNGSYAESTKEPLFHFQAIIGIYKKR